MEGEFWYADGQLIFCDGDAGVDVPNHECVVISHALATLAGYLNGTKLQRLADVIDSHMQDCEAIADHIQIYESVLAEAENMYREGELTDDEVDDLEATAYDLVDLPPGLWSLAFSQGVDERSYAQKEWGWIRILGTNVQAWERSPSVCGDIADALYEAYGDEAKVSKFTVEFVSDGKTYWDVPFSDIERGLFRLEQALH
ncbi:MAG: hypothetical protein KatS3mg109_0107 [Pirellulaceae bacterium]|nr:MAG: hypothetical protein KatS3mg109_0107 [Pirellulaceae bacterium]